MAITMEYRGGNFIKFWVVKYLKSLFLANSKGAITFTDGSKEISFTTMPYVGRTLEWEPQQLPAVLIDKATITMKGLSFAKDHIYEDRNTDEEGDDEVTKYRYVGGDMQVSLEILLRSRTLAEREKLADIVCIYLAHPDAKDYLGRQNIAISTPPVMSGESNISAPTGLDFPIYTCRVNINLFSQWVEKEAQDDPRLIDVISDVDANDS